MTIEQQLFFFLGMLCAQMQAATQMQEATQLGYKPTRGQANGIKHLAISEGAVRPPARKPTRAERVMADAHKFGTARRAG